MDNAASSSLAALSMERHHRVSRIAPGASPCQFITGQPSQLNLE